MTFKLRLSNFSRKEPITIPTTDLFEKYISVLKEKPDNILYSLGTLENGCWNWIAENANASQLINEIIMDYLSVYEENKPLPFYYLKLNLIGTSMVSGIISHTLYDNLVWQEEKEKVN